MTVEDAPCNKYQCKTVFVADDDKHVLSSHFILTNWQHVCHLA